MPADLEQLILEYEQNQALYRRLATKVNALLSELLQNANLRMLAIRYRVKNESSLRRKIEGKRGKYIQLADITDIVGFRVITYLSSDVDIAARIIEDEFDTDLENRVDKRQELAEWKPPCGG